MSDLRPPLAIVGMACRFPGGVTDVQSYWELMMDGRSGITETPLDRWDWRKYYHARPDIPGHMVTRWGGFLKDGDQFDAGFFGISPREAQHMDPQQRWALEVAWEALEDAGIPASSLRGEPVGVFLGVSSCDYSDRHQDDVSLIDVHTATGSAVSIVANRVSYLFDFKGPSLTVDTACSSSLVAVHLACRSVWSGQSSMALVGGVHALLNPMVSVGFSKASMLSPSGQCFAFDHRANGYVRSEVAGMVVLKPLDRAQADGDRIYAVIRAAAVNQDGRTSSLPVPSLPAQKAMLREAYREAGVQPSDVTYVEAHGTGTAVGDPIEARALGEVFSEGRAAGQPCLIGSVKSNIGHLEPASGIAGLIKGALIVHHRAVPPNRNFEAPNPAIPFEELALQVMTHPVRTPVRDGIPLVLGVNSFGFGGTNAHVVLAEAPADRNVQEAPKPARSVHLLCCSSRSTEGLKAAASAYLNLLEQKQETSIADIVASAAARREHHPERLVVMGSSRAELESGLSRFISGAADQAGVFTGRAASLRSQNPVFVYTGQGSQWWGMGQQLLQRDAIYRQTLEEIDRLLIPLTGWSVIAEMQKDAETSRIDRTDIAQPALFALQVGLTRLWNSWGVRPGKVVGHSIGEVAASYVAGIYSLEDAVKIVYHRSRLQHTTAGRGSMAAVGLTLAEALDALRGYEGEVYVAAVNSSRLMTLAGEKDALAAVLGRLTENGTFVRELPIDYAFHTPQMDPIREQLLSALADIRPCDGAIPLVSTVTGEAADGAAMDAGYWWRNVREPVLFAPAMERLVDDGDDVFLEVGPHPALQQSVRDCLALRKRDAIVTYSLKQRSDDERELAQNVAQLHVAGAAVDWKAYYPASRVTELPFYSWQRQSYWIESESRRRRDREAIEHPLLGSRLDGPHPTWERQIDARALSYLGDHRLWGRIVFPGAAYSEMGLAIGRALFPQEEYAVEELHVLEALWLEGDESVTLRSQLNQTDRSFAIYSRSKKRVDWTLHAHGYLRKAASAGPVAREDLAAIAESFPLYAETTGLYPIAERLGYQFGPKFQNIVEIRQKGDETFAVVEAPAETTETDGYHAHPALLDACYQAGIPLMREAQDPEHTGSALYLPVVSRRVRLKANALPLRFSVHTRLISREEGAITADIRAYDDSGELLLEVVSGRSEKVRSPGAEAGHGERLLYQPGWEPLNLEALDTPGNPRRYLCFADEGGITARVAQLLDRRGARVTVEAAISDQRDLRGLLDRVQPEVIVHGFSLDLPDPESQPAERLMSSQSRGVEHALELARVLAESKTRADVVFLTCGAQAVNPNDACSGLAAAPLAGFARVARSELADHQWRLIDLDPARPAECAEEVCRELEIGAGEREIAYRDGQRYVHRLRRLGSGSLPAQRANAIEPTGEVHPFRLHIRSLGQLNNLSLCAAQRRKPGAGEVEVRVHAGGLNFRDVLKTLGLYPGHAPDLRWLGDDFAGTVTAAGEGVTDMRPGDQVAGVANPCFQAYVTVPRWAVFPKPRHLPFAEAATLPTAFLTAHYAINHLARMERGESILIHAGAGGVGQAAIQIAQALGLQIFATAGSEEKRQFLRSQGVDYVSDSRTLGFADDILRWTNGRGVDAVLNSLAGDFIPKNLSVLAPYGRYLEIGKIDVYANAKIGLEALRNNAAMHIIDLAQVHAQKPRLLGRMLEELSEKFAEGVYSAAPLTVFPVTQAGDAFRYMAAGKHTGKIVLNFDLPEIPVERSSEVDLFRADRTYLIAGGSGGFGLEVAKWMASCGARRLALFSRRGPVDETARRAIKQLEADGVLVSDARGDVTVFEDVARVVNEIQRGAAPLGGVIHSAMVLNDAALTQLDWEGFRLAFAPKMMGAWNLHRATEGIELDHFVCFSSISSLVGAARQGNYNAGNAFLDALAHYRRSRGLKALTVNWGVLAEAGFVARHGATRQYLDAMGMGGLPLKETLAALGRFLISDTAQIVFADVDWERVAGHLPWLQQSRFVDGLLQANQKGGSDSVGAAKVLAAAPSQRPQVAEEVVGRMVAEVLGNAGATLDRNTPLNKLGVDSLLSTDLLSKINAQFGLYLSIGDLLAGSSISGLAAIACEKLLANEPQQGSSPAAEPGIRGAKPEERTGYPDTPVDLIRDMTLDATLQPAANRARPFAEAEAILVTGATGFVGGFLVAELLRETKAQIICLVRAPGPIEARHRLESALSQAGLWDEQAASRVKAIAGDLSLRRLGLPDAEWSQLAGQVDLVYHNGAVLNLVQPYSALRSANAGATLEILRLACSIKQKAVHYVSTAAVFFSVYRDRTRAIQETELPQLRGLESGYRQSKWVAEQLIRQAQARGIPASIYRPSLITGHSETGVTNALDLTSRFLQGCHQLGLWPQGNMEVNIAPVDYVAKAIVHLSSDEATLGGAYHVANPRITRLATIIECGVAMGYALPEVSYREWRAALIGQAEEGIQNALHPLLPLFPADLPEDAGYPIDCRLAQGRLEPLGIRCPEIGPELLANCARYLFSAGIIPRVAMTAAV